MTNVQSNDDPLSAVRILTYSTNRRIPSVYCLDAYPAAVHAIIASDARTHIRARARTQTARPIIHGMAQAAIFYPHTDAAPAARAQRSARAHRQPHCLRIAACLSYRAASCAWHLINRHAYGMAYMHIRRQAVSDACLSTRTHANSAYAKKPRLSQHLTCARAYRIPKLCIRTVRAHITVSAMRAHCDIRRRVSGNRSARAYCITECMTHARKAPRPANRYLPARQT